MERSYRRGGATDRIAGALLGRIGGLDKGRLMRLPWLFAAAMMVRHFIDHGHKAFLLVGGATGMIGDPDGKADERNLKTLDEIAKNKAGIAAQYQTIFAGKDFTVVDNFLHLQNCLQSQHSLHPELGLESQLHNLLDP